jgi:hypothetical protein
MVPKGSNTTFQGHSLKTLLAVGAACTALSAIGTLVATTKTKADEHIRLIAEAAAEPIRLELRSHSDEALRAMKPGGSMYEEFASMNRRVKWLVDDRTCRIDSRISCPTLAGLLP